MVCLQKNPLINPAFVADVHLVSLERWKPFTYDVLIARDKTNLDIFWLKDDSLEDTENLPAPDVLAQEIVEQLEAALEEFRSVEEALAINGDSE